MHSFLYFTPRIFSVYTKIFIFFSHLWDLSQKSNFHASSFDKWAHFAVLPSCSKTENKRIQTRSSSSFFFVAFILFVCCLCDIFVPIWLNLVASWLEWLFFQILLIFQKKIFLTLKKHEYNFEAIGVLNNYLINIGIPRHEMIVNIYMKIMKAYH